jgi:hypothetical protein
VRETQRVLCQLLGVPETRIRYLLNQPQAYGKLSRAELAAALGSERVAEVPFGGEEVSRSALDGLPLVMSRGNNPTARAILGVARELEQSGREAVALSAR